MFDSGLMKFVGGLYFLIFWDGMVEVLEFLLFGFLQGLNFRPVIVDNVSLWLIEVIKRLNLGPEFANL